jgi:sigma-54 dependent transcriptional regulator, acetoin dehydrogenase operon transcriptional activator AcoR
MGQPVVSLPKIGKAREAFLEGGSADKAVRADIATSWARSSQFHVRHDRSDVPQIPVEQLDDRLMDTVGPILDRLAEQLSDTNVGLLLSDASARILRRWSGGRHVQRFFDDVQTQRGSQLSEEAVGTNGVGTAVVSGRLVHVQGPEHLLDLYQRAVCTGAPIRDPLTGHTIGAVTLACGLSPHSQLLVPLLRSTIVEVEQHLLSQAMPRERQLIDAFLATTRSAGRPVIAVLGSTQVANAAARHILTATDVAQLEQTVAELCRHSRSGARQVRLPITLSGTRTGTATLRPVCEGGWVVELDVDAPAVHCSVPAPPPPSGLPGLVGDTAAWRAVVRAANLYPRSSVPTLVTGEAGVGKTAVAVAMCSLATDSGPVTVLDGALEQVDGTGPWLAKLQSALRSPGMATVVRHLDVLSSTGAQAMCGIIDTLPPSVTIVGTSSGARPEGMASAPLMERLGVATVAVPPLRERVDDLPALVRELARRHGRQRVMTLSPAALEALRRYSWPGNVRQLENVVRRLIADEVAPPVPLYALPVEIAAAAGQRSLTALEELELKAIRTALQAAEGNRVQAAASLGISRATLYRRLHTHRSLLDGGGH